MVVSRTELMVKRRYSHPRDRREFLHAQRLGIVGSEPGDRSRRPVTEVACRRDGAEALALRRSEDAVHDFALDQVAEKRNVLGSIEKLDQPEAGVQ